MIAGWKALPARRSGEHAMHLLSKPIQRLYIGRILKMWLIHNDECHVQVDAANFETAMRHQLRQFAGRRLSDQLAHNCSDEAQRSQVLPRLPRCTVSLCFIHPALIVIACLLRVRR